MDATHRSLGCKRGVNATYSVRRECLWMITGRPSPGNLRPDRVNAPLRIAGRFRLCLGGEPALRGRRMTLSVTLALAAAFLALTVFAGWRGARPPNFAKGPRLAPWRFIMLLAAAAAL